LFHLPIDAWWIFATSLGLAIPVFLELGFRARTPVFGGKSFFLILGLSLGIAQWLVLRVHIPRSVVWTAGTTISALAAGLASGWTIGSPFMWVVVGAGTALTLIWLVRTNSPNESPLGA
jgi:hypothetical protein